MSLWAFLICVCNEAGGPSKENKVVKRTKRWPLGFIVSAEFAIKKYL